GIDHSRGAVGLPEAGRKVGLACLVSLAVLPAHALLPSLAEGQSTAGVTIHVTTPQAPTDWALLQREIFRAAAAAADQFAGRYYDERGYLLSDLRWGMNDGPDDAIENINRWPEMYALGAPRNFMDLTKKIYDGHIRMYTEARTKYVPFAKDGMYYK